MNHRKDQDAQRLSDAPDICDRERQTSERINEVVGVLHSVADQLVGLGYTPAEISSGLLYLACKGTAQRSSGKAAAEWLRQVASGIEATGLMDDGPHFPAVAGRA